MTVYIVITLFLFKISIGFIGYRIYKIEKGFKNLKKENEEFQKLEQTKREIGWDSVWKMVNGRS